MHLKRVKIVFVAAAALVLFSLVGCQSTGAVARGWSGVAVTQADVYVATLEGKLASINITTHNRNWSDYKVLAPAPSGINALIPSCSGSSLPVAIYGTPATIGGLIYIAGYDGKVIAVTASSGQERWLYPRSEYLAPIVGGIFVSGSNIYFGTSKGEVYALDAATGDLKWKFQAGDKIWATPIVDNGVVFIGSFDRNIYAINADTGVQKWKRAIDGTMVASPVVKNGVVYFGAFDRYCYAINAADGSLKWRSAMAENWFWADVIVAGENVYAPNRDGNVYVLKITDGTLVQKISVDAPVSSSPVMVNNSVVVISSSVPNTPDRAVMYSIDTTTNTRRQLAEFTEKVTAPLSAGNGIIYVHTDNDVLYAVDAQNGTKLWNLSLK